jgi:putative inorganic carbon (hco3(-)) transporter
MSSAGGVRTSGTGMILLAVGVLGAATGVALVAAGAAFGLPVMLAPFAIVAAGVAGLSAPRRALGILFAAMPLGVVPIDVLGLRVIDAGMLAAVAIVAGAVLVRSVPLQLPPQVLWAGLFLFLAVASTLGAVDSERAVRQTVMLLAGTGLALASVTAIRSAGDLRWALGVLLGLGAVMSLAALPSATQIEARFGGAVVVNRAEGLFVHPNELASFAASVALIGLGMWLGATTRAARAASGVAGAMSVVALLLTLSRGAWIGLAAGVLVFALVLPDARRRLIVVGTAALLFVPALAALPPTAPQVEIVRDRLATVTDPSSNPYDARPAIWDEARRQVVERPLLGHGPDSFPVASVRPSSVVQTVGPVHAHNVLLTVAAELGIPAAATLILLVASTARLALRALATCQDRRLAALVAGLSAGIVALAVQGLVDFTFRNPVVFALVWTSLGLTWAAARLALGTQRRGRSVGAAA